jgi:16S rRNA (cytosine967-C5)-methyltransferase
MRSPHPADSLLHDFFRRHKAMGQQDRALIADGVFAWFRQTALAHRARADRDAAAPRAGGVRARARHRRPRMGRRRRCGRSRLAARVQGRLALPLAPAVAADLPDWLWERLGTTYGDAERAALARAWLAAASLDLRINPQKTTRDEARAALAASGLDVEPTPYSPLGLRVAGRPAPRASSLCSSQAPSKCRTRAASSSRFLVAPQTHGHGRGFLRGAGGKTLLLGALMRSQGRLYAFDTHERRLANLKPRLARSGLIERASATDRARARHEGEAPRRQDRPRACRRALHGVRHAAAQPRPQVAAAGDRTRRAHRQAASRSLAGGGEPS